MAPVRLRHPKGVSTIQVDFDSFTVQDLQQEIFAVTEIPPSQQDIKSGYPPQSLTIIPELPLSSLGLAKGEQLIVNQKVGLSSRGAPSAPTSPTKPKALPSSATTLASGGSSSTKRAPTRATPVDPGKPDSVETEGGVLVHRVVPDDNSCLFSSAALVFEQDITRAPQMRQVVADGIRKDEITYNEAILGRPVDQYISTILKPSTWGGAIELAVLASHYNTEIASVDVETGRIDHFSPTGGHDNGNRCILIYSGIHYDAATLAPMVDAPAEWHQTVFPIVSSTNDDSDPILTAAKKLADALRAKKAYTNTATFDLKCEQCGQGLKGEKGAREHAEATGHVRFGEY